MNSALTRFFARRSVDFVPLGLRNTIRRIPVIRTLQRLIIDRFLGGQSFVHTITAGPAKGLRIPVTLPGDKLIWAGTWELQFATAVKEAVSPGDTCCDIGSYRGYFAGVMASAGASRVHCFEPNVGNLKDLERFRLENPGFPIDVHPIAIGDEDGEVEFLEMPEPTMGKLASSGFQPELRSHSTSRVKVARLDTLFSKGVIGSPAIIKVDVEGAELDVLRGARILIGDFKPRFFIEAHSLELARSCTEFLEGSGYRVSILPTEGDSGRSPLREICHLAAVPAQCPGS